jgi:hypothetical protein
MKACCEGRTRPVSPRGTPREGVGNGAGTREHLSLGDETVVVKVPKLMNWIGKPVSARIMGNSIAFSAAAIVAAAPAQTG